MAFGTWRFAMLSGIFGRDGRRKYLTNDERQAVLIEASRQDIQIYTFCLVLAATGCRISEALKLSLDHVDRQGQYIMVECLKKRRPGIYRAIPVPSALVDLLYEVHGQDGQVQGASLWNWSRMTAWRKINDLMQRAGISGLQASPKGFRHGFGVSAIHSGVPLNMVQKWMGHADIRTTAIYTCAMGPEEIAIAERMWQRDAVLSVSEARSRR